MINPTYRFSVLRTWVHLLRRRKCNRFPCINGNSIRPVVGLLTLGLREASGKAEGEEVLGRGLKRVRKQEIAVQPSIFLICASRWSLLSPASQETVLKYMRFLQLVVIQNPASTIITDECTVTGILQTCRSFKDKLFHQLSLNPTTGIHDHSDRNS